MFFPILITCRVRRSLIWNCFCLRIAGCCTPMSTIKPSFVSVLITPSRYSPTLRCFVFPLSGWLGIRRGGRMPAYCKSVSISKRRFRRYCGVSK